MTQEQTETAVQDSYRVIEAMLFASSAPLSLQAMREKLPKDADVGGVLMALQSEYASRGVNLVEANGSWAFRTAADVSPSLRVTKDVQRRLSRAAMETLAIVAYHQPVTRAEIENIRGVVVHKGTLDVLMEMGWVKPGKRRETPGRPVTWVTTTAFMDHFGLESLNDLPGLDDLKAAGLLDRRPALDAMAQGSLFASEEDQLEADAALSEEDDSDDQYQSDDEDDETDDDEGGEDSDDESDDDSDDGFDEEDDDDDFDEDEDD